MDIATFLIDIGDDLARHGTTSRQIAAMEFDADGRDVTVLTRSALHAAGYPGLDVLLGEIGRTCLKEGVDIAQLRRIAFLEREIHVQWTEAAGQAVKTQRYPLEVPTLDS